MEAIRGEMTVAELEAKNGVHQTVINTWKRQAIEGMDPRYGIPHTVTVTIPFRVAKRGGRKEVQLPLGTNNHSPDYTLIKAVARAYRWRQILKDGDMGTIAELAEHEKISPSYLTRVMRLTLLAPDIIEAILDGNPPSVGMTEFLEPMTPVWAEQGAALSYEGR
ncbi:hypothetical protein M2324_001998 [Rhodovulum sulfidophilum]|nr:hypothetical protein [Rhodovulum sulfidophilum]